MNHSPRALPNRMLNQLQLLPSQHNVVFKSNNIIFTLNLLTTNLMNNNVCIRHEHDAKIR